LFAALFFARMSNRLLLRAVLGVEGMGYAIITLW
jgi:hypothetical protein